MTERTKPQKAKQFVKDHPYATAAAVAGTAAAAAGTFYAAKSRAARIDNAIDEEQQDEIKAGSVSY